MLLNVGRSVLVVVDIQERLLPAIADGDRVVDRTRILARAAGHLGVPVIVSEQYPKGLGGTVPALRDDLGTATTVEKIAFSCAAEPQFMAALNANGRDQIVICGIEAHVCVLQTALGLAAMGRSVHVVADAVSSRLPANAELALERMRTAGVGVVSSEMVVFEWLERAGTPAFKTLSALIK